jgi:hypothetical protein
LTVAGDSVEQPLTVLPDPRSDATAANLKAQTDFLIEVRDRISAIAADAEKLRNIRDQLEARHRALSEEPGASRLVALGEEALARVAVIEKMLYNPNAKVNYDILAGRDGGARLYSRSGWLYLTGFDHNGPPTQGMREVNREQATLYEQARDELRRLIGEDLKRLNDLAGELGTSYLTAAAP